MNVELAGTLTGTVASFDAHVGLGSVAVSDGRELPFHCVAIADGSRQIAVGQAVTLRVGPGLPGVWEARTVSPTPF